MIIIAWFWTLRKYTIFETLKIQEIFMATKFHLFDGGFCDIQIPCNFLPYHKPLMIHKWNFYVLSLLNVILIHIVIVLEPGFGFAAAVHSAALRIRMTASTACLLFYHTQNNPCCLEQMSYSTSLSCCLLIFGHKASCH